MKSALDRWIGQKGTTGGDGNNSEVHLMLMRAHYRFIQRTHKERVSKRGQSKRRDVIPQKNVYLHTRSSTPVRKPSMACLQITHIPLMPTRLMTLTNSPLAEQYNLTSWTSAGLGGGVVPATVIEDFRQKFKLETLYFGKDRKSVV